MVEVVCLNPIEYKHPVKSGVHYNEKFFKTKIIKNTDCYVGDKLLFSFRKNVLNNDKWLSIAKKHLQKKILTSDRRMTAGAARSRVLINSGIVGYYDRLTPQMKAKLGVHKAGRKTAFTYNYPTDWKAVIPLFEAINKWYKKVSPYYYGVQRREAKLVEPNLLIGSTVFSTGTVNKNWRTATHTDHGNFGDAMSCIAVLGEGIRGGFLTFPQYKIAVDVQPGDVILMNGHEQHGNTEMKINKGGCRFSIVCYLRKDMSLFHNPIWVDDHLYYIP